MSSVQLPELRLFPHLPSRLKQTQSRELITTLGFLRRVIVGSGSRTQFGRSVKVITASALTVSPSALFRVAWMLNELSPSLNISMKYNRSSTELYHCAWYGENFAHFVVRLTHPVPPNFDSSLSAAAQGDSASLVKLLAPTGLLWIPSAANGVALADARPMPLDEALKLAEPVERTGALR